MPTGLDRGARPIGAVIGTVSGRPSQQLAHHAAWCSTSARFLAGGMLPEACGAGTQGAPGPQRLRNLGCAAMLVPPRATYWIMGKGHPGCMLGYRRSGGALSRRGKGSYRSAKGYYPRSPGFSGMGRAHTPSRCAHHGTQPCAPPTRRGTCRTSDRERYPPRPDPSPPKRGRARGQEGKRASPARRRHAGQSIGGPS